MLLQVADLRNGNVVMPKHNDGNLYKVSAKRGNVTLIRLTDRKVFPIERLIKIGHDRFFDFSNYIEV